MKKRWKLAPCPSYDLERTESWLQDMAKEGLFLTEDGFLLGGAIFEERTPCSMRYRLEASEKPRSLWDDNGGDPDLQAQELCEEVGWKYICSRGQYYIYATESQFAPELHTDPEIQAMNIKELKKRQRSSIFNLSFWICIYPLLGIAGYFFTTLAILPLWMPLTFLLLSLVELASKGHSLRYLRNLQKRLENGEEADHQADWRKNKNAYWLMSGINWLLTLVMICSIAKLCMDNASNANRMKLEEYTELLPFATIADFGSGHFGYDNLGSWTNHIEVGSTYLAPTIINMSQTGKVAISDDTNIGGGLDVNYMECRYHWMAKYIAKEMLRYEKRNYHRDDFHFFQLPEMDVDYAVAFTGVFPTVIIADGNKVILAEFYQTTKTTLELADWAGIIAESIKE